jgi:hypothetical protein
MKFIFLFFLGLISNFSFAQGVEITLLNEKTNEPIIGAQFFILETDQSFKTNDFGKITIFENDMKLCQIRILALGYKSILQKIVLSPSLVIKLSPMH